MKTKHHLLFSAACIILALISCNENTVDPVLSNQPVKTISDPGLDSLQVEFTSATVQYHGMPVVGVPPAKAFTIVTLALHNASLIWKLDSLIVVRASIMKYPEYVGLMTFHFDNVYRIDGSDWNAQLEPNQKDTLWCSYRFEPVIFFSDDSLVIRCEIIDRHGNAKYVDSFPIVYQQDL